MQHKIQRGYLPSRTHSVHYIRDEGFREAVSTFLRRESGQIEYTLEALTAQASPYKQPQPLQST
jgi:predicted N-acyltransferase